MFNINFILAFCVVIVFTFFLFFKKIDNYLYILILYLVLISFIFKIIYVFFPPQGTNFLHASKYFILLLLFISLVLKYNIFMVNTILGKLILLYIFIFTLFACFGIGDFNDNRKELMNAPLLMSFYFVGLIYFKKDERIKQFFKFLLIFYTINIIYAIFQQIFGLPEFEKNHLLLTKGTVAFTDSIDPITGNIYYKVMGFSGFNYSLFYILSMLAIIVISAREYFTSEKKIIKLFLFFYLILLIFTLERTPIMMLSFLPFALVKNKGKLIVYLISILIFIYLLNIYQDQLLYSGYDKFKRFAEIINPMDESTNLSYRMNARWINRIPMIIENPFGIGVSNVLATAAHNNYLKIFLQVGWFGGFLFLFILLKSIHLCYFTYKRVKITLYAQLILGIMAASLAMFATGMPNIPFGYDCAIFFWLFLGMVERLSKIYEKK